MSFTNTFNKIFAYTEDELIEWITNNKDIVMDIHDDDGYNIMTYMFSEIKNISADTIKKVINHLLDLGLDIDKPDMEEFTALKICFELSQSDTELFEFLLHKSKSCIDINPHIKMTSGHCDKIKIMYYYGIDLSNIQWRNKGLCKFFREVNKPVSSEILNYMTICI